jgi:RluA family pseudouridine synthase
VRKLVVAGAAYINGRRVRIASKPVQAGAEIDVYVDEAKLFEPESRDQVFRMNARHVLFEDEHVIVVDKPPGLPTQPTLDEARDNLFAAVQRFVRERDGRPDAYIGLHHRLDRDTSGVILFTKSKAANAGVADMFALHTARKIYQAITLARSTPPASWTVRNYLGKISSEGKRAKFGSVLSGGDPAHTEFELLGAAPGAAWVQASPITGRTHQIRIHLSEGGYPIIADRQYGVADRQYGGAERSGATPASTPAAPRLMLHAASLTFPHPVHKNEILVRSELPEDFRACLRSLSLKN